MRACGCKVLLSFREGIIMTSTNEVFHYAVVTMGKVLGEKLEKGDFLLIRINRNKAEFL